MSRRSLTARIGYFNHTKPAASLVEAQETNNPHYYGKPCGYGHSGVRDTGNHQCIACRNAAIRLADPAKVDKPPGRNPKLIREIEFDRDIKAANCEVWDE